MWIRPVLSFKVDSNLHRSLRHCLNGNTYTFENVSHLNWSDCFLLVKKLEGVGPIDNRPSTDKVHHFVPKIIIKKWHVTHDILHVTRDTWHMTGDTWHAGAGEHSLKISDPWLLLFVIYDIMKIWRKRLTDWINQWISDKAVYRTAPATPGLLNIL